MQDMLKKIPDSIDTTDSEMIIQWRDGKECRYDLLILRKNCPCATCRGGHGPVNRITGHITEIALKSWEKVGRYGIKIVWSDGHDDGIYTYEILRDSCDQGITFPDD